MRKEIIEKIIEILRNDAELPVKYFYFGRPITPIDYPFCVVEPAPSGSRNISDRTHDKRKHVFLINILIFTRSVKPDEAEKTALEYIERVYIDIVNNNTLDGLTADMLPILITPEAPLYEGEHAISVQRLSVEAWWLE
ncbi:MAG: hypothetical protein QW761_00215 [Candidatus Aenigmatarchaeota archaeon]